MFSFWNAKFFFESPSPQSDFLIPLVIVFAILVLIGTAFLLFANKKADLPFRKYAAPFFVSGGLGFIHLFARYESLPWLNERFFLVLVTGCFLIWLTCVSVILAIKMPKHLLETEAEEKFNKYLPKTAKGSKLKAKR